MSERYQPELGQMMFGQPSGDYALPPFVESMFIGIYDECRRIFWNTRQKEYEDCYDADLGGVHLRHYSWTHDDEDAGPNFWVDSDPQRIRWYKHVGRGMSCEHQYTHEQWIGWHHAVVTALEEYERKMDAYPGGGLYVE